MCLLHPTTLRHSRLHRSVHFIQPDRLGSPRVVIDAARNLPVWTWELTGEAFGSTPPNADPDGDGQAFTLNMRFPGQRYDSATGLNYNYFRDYEPGTGRYSISDPVGHLGGLNTYAYANSSPLVWFDPDGLQAKPKPQVPSSPPSTPRYPNMPAANDPVFGPNRTPGAIGAALRMCLNPYVAAVLVGMMIPNSTSPCDTFNKPQQCDDDDDNDDCKQKATEWELRQSGIDAHEVKKGLGQVSFFEICKCKSGGFAVKRKGCQGPIIFRL